MADVELRAMPDVPPNLELALKRFLDAVRHNFYVLAGFKGTESNKGVTFGDLDALAGIPQYVAVDDIDDPSPELSSASSDTNGNIIIAHENTEYTVYSWRSEALTEDSPYLVGGAGGSWIAIAGKYTNMDFALNTTTAVYFGLTSENGSYRIIRSGDDLSVQRRESGTWVEKGGFTAV